MEEVTITFDDKNNPVISVKGVKGKGCKDLTKALEQKLGKVTKDVETREYRENEVSRANSRVHNRR